MSSATPEFLFVRPGDYVAIKNEENCEDIKKKNKNYWSVKLSTVLEELEIQIHGPYFK